MAYDTLYSSNSYLSVALKAFVGPWSLFKFLEVLHSQKDSLDGEFARPKLPADRTAQTQNKRTQTSMQWVGFEPTTPMYERAKSLHTLDRAVTLIGGVFLRIRCAGHATRFHNQEIIKRMYVRACLCVYVWERDFARFLLKSSVSVPHTFFLAFSKFLTAMKNILCTFLKALLVNCEISVPG
jgi:hypothetical protein